MYEDFKELAKHNGVEVKDNRRKEVQTNMGSIPIEDYREIKAMQNGFDSYDDMYNQGYRLGDGYDKNLSLLFLLGSRRKKKS